MSLSVAKVRYSPPAETLVITDRWAILIVTRMLSTHFMAVSFTSHTSTIRVPALGLPTSLSLSLLMMLRMLLCTLLLSILSLPAAALAEHQPENRELILATSEGPPYMIKDPVGGLDVDTVKQALENRGYRVKIIFVSLNRAMAELKAGRVDLTVPSFAVEQEGLYNGDPHILYRPTVFSLKDSNIKLTRVSDMGKYRITSFQGVTGYFGPELLKATQDSPDFHEHRSMAHLVDMLMNKRTDLVLIDYWIFDYYYRKSRYSRAYIANDQLFARVPAMPVFNNKKIRDEYNLGLKAIHKNGKYRQIMTKFGHD